MHAHFCIAKLSSYFPCLLRLGLRVFRHIFPHRSAVCNHATLAVLGRLVISLCSSLWPRTTADCLRHAVFLWRLVFFRLLTRSTSELVFFACSCDGTQPAACDQYCTRRRNGRAFSHPWVPTACLKLKYPHR